MQPPSQSPQSPPPEGDGPTDPHRIIEEMEQSIQRLKASFARARSLLQEMAAHLNPTKDE